MSNRRIEIINMLNKECKTIKGTELAKTFNVSRQVIVQDIAILRAEGFNIMATPQGYIIPNNVTERLKKAIVSKHQSIEDMEEELSIMIDLGAKVLDVIVEHPIYGEVKGILNIGYREELNNFLKQIKSENAEPLSSLTDGIHIHNIEVPSEENFIKIKEALIKKGYLILN